MISIILFNLVLFFIFIFIILHYKPTLNIFKTNINKKIYIIISVILLLLSPLLNLLFFLLLSLSILKKQLKH
jgi:hypothetical protein